jgi:hypothetical protein
MGKFPQKFNKPKNNVFIPAPDRIAVLLRSLLPDLFSSWFPVPG